MKPLHQGQKWVLFSQDRIFNHYGKILLNHLIDAKFCVELILLPDGEVAKSISEVENIYSQLIKMGCDRSATFMALGGGVVGDVTGFIASTFMRGVDYIQIPTTLLAMVDSSIGGKTGINLLHGKNLIGTIWQPKAVVIDPELLSSLPKREITSAMGEIIKYSVIFDRDLFALIEKNLDLLLDCSKCSQLNEIIGRCTKLKADIIVEDERENGKRRILNFGHTIGHALETYFGFNILRHGEAIAYGILAAAELSIEYAKLEHQQFDLIKNIIKRLPLPKLPNFSSKNIIQLMQSDKKIQFGKINFILLEDIGSAVVQNNISEESIINILEAI